MTTTMDIAVCFDCSLSMSFYSKQIRRIILSILRKVLLLYDESDIRMAIRMALIKLQSHTDDWVTKVNPFTSSMEEFEKWINDIQTKGENSYQCKAIADALNVCLSLDWRPNTNPGRHHEKLVILITDGPPCNLFNDQCPCNSNDLWKVSNEFLKQDITLAIIGIEPSIVECDDFYCALANNTGGEYIPLINASRILSFVIQEAILGEYTLSQVFRHIDYHDIECNSLYHYLHVEKRARFMIEYCHTMIDIRNKLYTYRRQWTKVDHLYSNKTNATSTPITDDEGYRTRLPTTASVESSFNDYSPVLSRATMDFDWDSEVYD